MSLSVASIFQCNVTETIGQNANSLGPNSNKVVHNAFTRDRTLNAAASGFNPGVTETAFFRTTLTAGAATINLASLTSTNGRTLDATGLKLIEVLLVNESSNDMTIKQGASNGYTGYFTEDGTIVAKSGGICHQCNPNSAATIASGVRTLDVTGTGTDILLVGLVFGPAV